MEDVDAVFDQDPQRVCILQGPVAIKHSTVKDEPIKEMLDNVTNILVEKLLERTYGGDAANVPTIDYLGAVPSPVSVPRGVNVAAEDNQVIFSTSASVPPTLEFLMFLTGSNLNWWNTLVSSINVIQGTSYVDNPIRHLFAPRPN